MEKSKKILNMCLHLTEFRDCLETNTIEKEEKFIMEIVICTHIEIVGCRTF